MMDCPAILGAAIVQLEPSRPIVSCYLVDRERLSNAAMRKGLALRPKRLVDPAQTKSLRISGQISAWLSSLVSWSTAGRNDISDLGKTHLRVGGFC